MSVLIKHIDDSEKIQNLLDDFDAEFIPNLHDATDNFEAFKKKIAAKATTICAYLDENIIGFCSFYNNDNDSKYAYITLIAVKEGYRGHKVGKLLLEECIKMCEQSGMKAIKLEVMNDNVGAIKFYEKYGFCYTANASENSSYMEKEI